jgi:hypothetical protein
VNICPCDFLPRSDALAQILRPQIRHTPEQRSRILPLLGPLHDVSAAHQCRHVVRIDIENAVDDPESPHVVFGRVKVDKTGTQDDVKRLPRTV